MSTLPRQALVFPNEIQVRPLILPQRSITKSQDQRDAKRRIAEAVLSPDLFAQTFLQAELWDKQIDILKAITEYPRVAVKACHSSSKTYSAAIALLWFLARHSPEAVVVTTAPTWGQVERLLWGEVHSALARSRYPFPEATQTGLKIGPKRYAYGLSTSVTKQDEGVKFQGIHAANVLIILDEAPGVDPKIWTAIEGNRAGGNVKILALGNPTISSGPFHDAFTENRGGEDKSGWKCFTIDAFDTPNLRGINLEQLLLMTEEELDENSCPYLTTRRWVKEKYYEWGEGHPLWEARVRGQFPKQSEDALLSLSWLEEAKIKNTGTAVGKVNAGVDVSGPGEAETSLTIRRGGDILIHKQWPISDPRGEIVAALNPFRSELEAVNVDSIGLGWGMYTHLKELGFPAVPVNITEPSDDTEKYSDQKAEFYWGLRMRLSVGDLSGLLDEKTIGQLASIRYKHNARGQIEIESKEQAAKRGVKSPDRAESIMLAFATRMRVYGVLDLNKQVMMDHQKFQASTLMKPMISDKQLNCPECEAVCVVPCNGGMRCNQCGHQWALTTAKDKMPQVTRNDALMKMRSRYAGH